MTSLHLYSMTAIFRNIIYIGFKIKVFIKQICMALPLLLPFRASPRSASEVPTLTLFTHDQCPLCDVALEVSATVPLSQAVERKPECHLCHVMILFKHSLTKEA